MSKRISDPLPQLPAERVGTDQAAAIPGWPSYRTARQLSGSVFPKSPTVILETAHEYDIGRRWGRDVVSTPADTERLYECLPCLSNSSPAKDRRTSSCAAPSAESDMKKALALATSESRS